MFTKIFAMATTAAIFVGTSLESQQIVDEGKFLITASIDGYVVDAAEVGASLSPSTSLNEWPSVLSSESCNHEESIGDIAAFPKVLLEGLKVSGQEVAVPLEGNTLVLISSPLLSLQLVDALRNLAHNQDSLGRLENELSFQQQIDSEINNLEFTKKRFDEIYVHQDSNLGAKTPDKQDELSQSMAAQLVTLFNTIEHKEEFVRIAKQRQYRIESLDKMRADIANSVRAAECQVKILEASISVGKLSCPQSCKVVRLYVLPGQWVTKGDPVALVEKN